MAGAVPDDHLPESLAAHQRKEGPQGVLDADHYGLVVAQLALADPAAARW